MPDSPATPQRISSEYPSICSYNPHFLRHSERKMNPKNSTPASAVDAPEYWDLPTRCIHRFTRLWSNVRLTCPEGKLYINLCNQAVHSFSPIAPATITTPGRSRPNGEWSHEKSFLFLGFTDAFTGRISGFFVVFGRAPFFYYLLRIYVIHALATCDLVLSGRSWTETIKTAESWFTGVPQDFGHSLPVVYAVWVIVIACIASCFNAVPRKTSPGSHRSFRISSSRQFRHWRRIRARPAAAS